MPLPSIGDEDAPTPEKQLDDLRSCGIAVRDGRTVEELLASASRGDFERHPYLTLLMVLGGEVEGPPWGRRFSDDVWHFDTEGIEDDGAYVEIAERMRALAGAALPLDDLHDHVDIDNETAWLEFELEGRVYHWDAEVQDDWVDPSILSRFSELLIHRNRGVRFTYLDLGGQDCILGAATEEQLRCLREKTGLDFVWLE